MVRAKIRNPYYRLLDAVARFFQEGRALRRKVVVASSVFGLLILSARIGGWHLAMQAGELPGTAGFERAAFAFLMAVLCAAALMLFGLLTAAHWAQRAGHIPDYSRPVVHRD